jgi:AcrR family transcriptional regulator
MSSSTGPERRAPYDADTLADVAMRVFRERGYDATSMQQLASAAGISKAAFYHHVSGKEDLLQAGMQRALDALEALFDEPGASAGRAIDQLAYVLRRVVELEHSLLAEVTVLLRTRGNSPVERAALDRRRAFDHRIGDVVAEAQREGDVRKDLDPPLTGRLIIGMATWLVEWYRPDGPLDAVSVADHVVGIALQGIADPTRKG